MDINALRAFALVAKLGNLTKAAALLFTSQPAISVQIKALEEELGATLFIRSNKGMALTPTGIELLPHAEEVLNRVKQLRLRADELKGTITGVVRLGTISSAALLRLPELLMYFSTKYPSVSIQLEHGNSSDVRHRLRKNSLTCGFIFGEVVDAEIQALPLCDIALNIVGPAAWHERIRNATWSELVTLPWVCPPMSCPFRDVLEKLFVDEGARPEVYVEANDEMTLKELVEKGVGVTILRESDAKQPIENGHFSIWHGARPHIGLSFCFLREREHDPLVHAMASTMRQIWIGKLDPFCIEL